MRATVKRATVEQRRIEILETTCQVVIERGFAATRVSDVASRLGVSTGLIHYHFDSKELLLAEALALRRRAGHRPPGAGAGAGAHRARPSSTRCSPSTCPRSGEPSWMLWIDGWGEALRNPTMRRISQDLDVAWKDRLVVDHRDRRRRRASSPAPIPQAAAWRLSALLDGLGVQFTVHEGVLSRGQLLGYVRAAAALELGSPRRPSSAPNAARSRPAPDAPTGPHARAPSAFMSGNDAPCGRLRLTRYATALTTSAGASDQCTAERTAATPDALPSGASRSQTKRSGGRRRKSEEAVVIGRASSSRAGRARSSCARRWRRSGRRRRGRAGPTASTARSCPTAAGTRRRCAG